jgi:hypothetical protein
MKFFEGMEEGDAIPVGRVVETMTLRTLMTKTTKQTSKGGEPELLRLASRVCNLIAVRVINDYASRLSPCAPSSTPRRW